MKIENKPIVNLPAQDQQLSASNSNGISKSEVEALLLQQKTLTEAFFLAIRREKQRVWPKQL